MDEAQTENGAPAVATVPEAPPRMVADAGRTARVRRFLQTEFWAEFKGAHGWKPLYFVPDSDGALAPADGYGAVADEAEALSVLVRSFSAGFLRFSLAYVPMAPEPFSSAQPADGKTLDTEALSAYFYHLRQLAVSLKAFLPKNTLFVRFDPPLDYGDLSAREQAKQLPARLPKTSGTFRLQKSDVDVQPPDTVLLALDKSEDELLAAMKSKWRYNIRLAAKKGVQVSRHCATDEDFDEMFGHFYALFRQTGERDGVSFHGRDYYRDLLRRGAPDAAASPARPVVTLYLARHEGDFLAGIITLFCPREAVYLYGASGNTKRNFMPAYLLQWTAICDAKRAGCPVYDFYGMPPTDDETHPMHGLYLFKTGFGGTIVHRPGSFDVPVKPSLYRLYTAAERFRAWFFKKAMKKLRHR